MQERLILEMVRDRRISVGDAMILLGFTDQSKTPCSQPEEARRTKRRPKTMTTISVERHFEIVKTAQKIGRIAAARRLGMPVETVSGHLRYAGLAPASPSKIEEIEMWRKRRNLYLDVPIMIKEKR